MKIRDRRTRGWLPIQNEIVDHWMSRMGPTGVSTYLVLARYADRHDSSYPRYETIAAKVGVSRRTIIRTMKLLEKLGLVEVERERRRNDGTRRSNVYTLVDPPGMSIPGGQGDSMSPCQGDMDDTRQSVPQIIVEKNQPPQQEAVVGAKTTKPEDDILAIWQSARHATGTPCQSDHDCARAILEQHGVEQAVGLVRALAGVVERRYPECRRLSYAWSEYGRQAVDAVRAEALAEERQADSRRRIEEGRREREEQAEIEAAWSCWSAADHHQFVALASETPFPQRQARQHALRAVRELQRALGEALRTVTVGNEDTILAA